MRFYQISTIMLSIFILETTAAAQTPAGIKIRSVNYAGTLCPSDSVVAYWHGPTPGAVLSLSHDQFFVEAGRGMPLRPDARKNCQMIVNFEGVSGWTYAVQKFSTAALAAHLPTGSRARIQIRTPVNRGPTASLLQAELLGPKYGDVRLISQDAYPLVFAPCAKATALSLANTVQVGPVGMLTGDSVDLSPTIHLHLVWRRCP